MVYPSYNFCFFVTNFKLSLWDIPGSTGHALWTDALWVCDDAAVYRGGGEESNSIAREWQGPGRGGLRRGLRVGAAAEESQAARRASEGAREEQNGGAGGGVERRQILEEQSILEGSNHVQMYVISVGFQARRSATGGSPPPINGVRRSDRCTARRGAPPCDLRSCGKYCYFAGSRRNGGWIGAMQGARG
jgi:hypothetical protein